MITPKHILLTIDVEDWFQVENFKPYIPFSSWPERELRVEQNTHRLLDLFDACEVGDQKTEDRNQSSDFRRQKKVETRHKRNMSDHFHLEKDLNKERSQKSSKSCPKETNKNRIKATFFTLGWLAERLPNLVREIQSRGHEVASHGYHHQLPDQLSVADFKMDLTGSKKRLEDLIGSPVSGYRAPSFAINDDKLKIIEDCGYLYDSSYNSFGLHGRYGRISLNETAKLGIAHKISDKFFELPISNLSIKNPLSFEPSAFSPGRNKKKRIVLPWGGGGYFRLVPYRLFRRGVQSILENDGAYAFYFHPWELDPGQPRVKAASMNYKFRHYAGLNGTSEKLQKLTREFSHCGFITCSRYLELNGGLLI
jgi:polysaccharide deacetylase family protein (PEP-CTERM system associated)